MGQYYCVTTLEATVVFSVWTGHHIAGASISMAMRCLEQGLKVSPDAMDKVMILLEDFWKTVTLREQIIRIIFFSYL